MKLRVKVTSIPAQFDRYGKITLAVQKGKQIEQRFQSSASDEAVFEYEADAYPEGDIRGPYVNGPRGQRFLYLVWLDNFGVMFRRIKVQLNSVLIEFIEPDACLECTIHGLDKKGGPACATVPLVVGWHRVSV